MLAVVPPSILCDSGRRAAAILLGLGAINSTAADDACYECDECVRGSFVFQEEPPSEVAALTCSVLT